MSKYRLKQTDLAFDPLQPRGKNGRWVFRHLITRSGGGYESHSVAAFDREDKVRAVVTWNNQGPNRGAINSLWTDPEFRRQGLASEVVSRARKIKPDLKHSAERSDLGDKFARKTDATPVRRRKVESADEAEQQGKQSATVAESQYRAFKTKENRPVFIMPEIIDLATPQQEPVQKHVQPPPVESDQTIQSIAKVLLAATTAAAAVEGLAHLLAAYGITKVAVQAAFDLASGGTAHRPNARLAEFGVKASAPNVKVAKDREVFYRAAYFANAAKRIQAKLRAGESLAQAVHEEEVNFERHERARKGRLDSAAQVEYVAETFGWPDEHGTLVGWYLNPFLNNEVECKAANGNNFYAEEGTIIGLPGSVHANCGCYAGPPHQGARMVNDVLRNIVVLDKHRKPRFKLKESRKHG